MSQNDLAEQHERDAASLVMIGTFFTVLALLVLCGTFWATGRTHAMIVNLGAGGTLLAVGLAMLGFGRRSLRALRRARPENRQP